MSYIRYADFDADYKFAEKAGFALTPVQVECVEKFVGWPVSLNSSDVGSGKTVISTVVALMRGRSIKIVVVPPVIITQWVKWLHKVSDKVICYRGTPSERKALRNEKFQWLVMSHTILRMDFDWVSTLRDVELVVDEAHFLKSSASRLFKETQAMSQHAYVQLLTGTPVSKPMDAYAYIKLATPDVYRSLGQFETIHVIERNFFQQPIAYGELDLLKSNFALRSIGKTKEETHGYDLQPLYPETSYELSAEHTKLYRRLLDEQLLLFDDNTKIDATSVSKLFHAAQQIVVNFDHFSNDPSKRSTAYNLVDMVIEDTRCSEVSRSKLIIWVKYRMTAARMLSYCNSLGVKTVASYGGADSEKSIEAFMSDPETRILIGQPQSCGVGLNAQLVCSEALFLEYDSTPLLSRQSVGRIVRIGQTVKPTIRFAVALGTVQERMLQMLLSNDDLVVKIEPTKAGLRAAMGL